MANPRFCRVPRKPSIDALDLAPTTPARLQIRTIDFGMPAAATVPLAPRSQPLAVSPLRGGLTGGSAYTMGISLSSS